jgi:DNA phosphorothioation-associated putative methyltransferase
MVARHRTAIIRYQLSRPMKLAVGDGLIGEHHDVFDYGCGHADDLRILMSEGVRCAGWDPVHRPSEEPRPADIVNLGYVVNVVEDPNERASVLQRAWALARKVLVVAARLSLERGVDKAVPFGDGCLTGRRTFQKFYEQHELRGWIEATLGVSAIAAGPGVFYVFRDASMAQAFLASRYRRAAVMPRQRRSERIFEEHRTLFEELMQFVTERGRLPEEEESPTISIIREKIGGVRRAWRLIEHVTGTEEWARIRAQRSQDLLIYVALARFGGRPRLTALPRRLQLDIRAFFGTYAKACDEADRLLFASGDLSAIDKACQESQVGKLTPTALYIHVSALEYLPSTLRVYEGCARSYIGAVDAANVVKLNRRKPQISYLSYPTFEREAHPALLGTLVVPLQTFRVDYRDYSSSKNPPILHRKEEFISAQHPLRERFSRLTSQEERAGLYENSDMIGTREGWRTALDTRGVEIRGHRVFYLRRSRASASS